MENYDFKLKKIDNNSFELSLFNNWNNQTLSSTIKELENQNLSKESKLIVDFQGLSECDNSAMIYLISFFRTFQEQNVTLHLDKYEDSFQRMEIIFKKHSNRL